MTYKRRSKHKRRKLVKIVKVGLPALGLIITSGCEVTDPTFSNPKSPLYDYADVPILDDGNPNDSLYDADTDLAGEASPDAGIAGESTAGEIDAGESTAGETAAGESAAGESTAGETTAGESAAGESAAGTE